MLKMLKAARNRSSEEPIAKTNYLSPGQSVAVKLPTNSFWITANILKYISEKGKYEVMDAEDDEENPGTRK